MALYNKLMYNPKNNTHDWIAIENIPAFRKQGWYMGAPPIYLEEFDKISKKNPSPESHVPETKYSQCGIWEITDPVGKKYFISNLLRFCRNRNLPYVRLSNQLDGWKCIKIGKLP